MSRYCLDTSAYSHFKRGHPPVVELLDGARWVGVPSIVVGEPVVEEIPIDSEMGQIYAEIVIALQRSGTPVPSNDIWIAAAAVRVGAPVLTYDPHFSAMERVGSLVLPAP